MKILLINALDIYGGGEFFVYQFSLLLRKYGHEVWVSCREDNPIKQKCEKEGIPVITHEFPEDNKKNRLVKNIISLKDQIRKNNIDIVHTNTNYDRTAGAFAAKLGGARHITTNHSFHSISHNLTHWIRNKFFTDHFIVDGECTRELMIKEDRIDSKKISLIHLGINYETLKRDNELRAKVRNEWGISDDITVIGNVARMVEFKGQEYLIRAYAKIALKHPESVCVIVGSGKLESYLKDLTNSLGLKDKIIFPGFRDDMQAVYSAFDIYAHTSVEGGGETFPYAVLYALANGLPVIVTKVGDVPAMVKEGINGFVTDDKDIDNISQKLMKLLEDKESRRSMGEESLKYLQERFTTEKMTSSILQVYKKLNHKSVN